MKVSRTVLLTLTVALLTTLISVAAFADDWNKKSIVNFSQTIEVPGKTLPAGTYVFKVANNDANRFLVQVWNKDETELIDTVQAIPNQRLTPTDKVVMTFGEAPPNQPDALRAWFYPGHDSGFEFAYPKDRATELAKRSHEEVPVMQGEEAKAEDVQAEAKQTAEGNVQQSAEMNTPSASASAAAQPATPTEQGASSSAPGAGSATIASRPEAGAAASESDANASASAPASENTMIAQNQTPESELGEQEQLPQTGSLAPLLGLIGLALSGAGFGLKKFWGRL
jgi:LPXTG-motif cell wall-anchored protein